MTGDCVSPVKKGPARIQKNPPRGRLTIYRERGIM
jgi:hypothetical protein